MKLLFDHNLSHRLCSRLEDVFPQSTQVRLRALSEAEDSQIWAFAREHGFVIVTLDADFAEMAALVGPPPKVVWLRCGNQPTALIETLLRDHAAAIQSFVEDPEKAFLELGHLRLL